MRSPRFTIAGLLWVVAFLAVAVAALRSSTDSWDCAVLGLTMVALLASVLLAVHRKEDRRAYWLGFALFGSAYLVLSLVPSVEYRLPTTKMLAYLDSKIPGRTITITGTLNGSTGSPAVSVSTVAFSPQGRSMATMKGSTLRIWDLATGRALVGPNGTTENFVQIGHSLLALVMACLGASLSRRFQLSGQPVPADL